MNKKYYMATVKQSTFSLEVDSVVYLDHHPAIWQAKQKSWVIQNFWEIPEDVYRECRRIKNASCKREMSVLPC